MLVKPMPAYGLADLEAFGRMLRETPALRAALGAHRQRIVAELAAVLATELGSMRVTPNRSSRRGRSPV